MQTREDRKAQQQFQFAMDTLTEFRGHVRNCALDSKHVVEVLGATTIVIYTSTMLI